MTTESTRNLVLPTADEFIDQVSEIAKLRCKTYGITHPGDVEYQLRTTTEVLVQYYEKR